MISTQLIAQARNHVNRKHSATREAALLAEGLPATDRAALQTWIATAEQANEDEEADAGRAVFHACTVRLTSGADAGLPTRAGIGCRIDFIPLTASILTDEEAWNNSPDEFGEVRWSITWGNFGTGFKAREFVSAPPADQPSAVVARHRAALLLRDDTFANRAEALAAVQNMLARRTAK